MANGLMAGKRGLIMGLANDKSIAWGIAKAVAAEGAELAFSYQGEALLKRVQPLAAEVGSTEIVECDVSDEGSLDRLFEHLQKVWGKLDFVVHAIGFSDKNELRGRYVDTGPENFRMTMDISVYSFTAVCRRAAALMPDGGSLLTLTYYGAERVMPHYNVMGVAKAALEAAQKQPPTTAATIATRESTIVDLKTRMADLAEAKATIAARLDRQIAGYQAQVATLEKQIEEDKKRAGEQPTAPRTVKRKGKEK